MDTDDADWVEILSIMRDAQAKSRDYAVYWEWRIDRQRTEEYASLVLVNFLAQKGELTEGIPVRYKPDPPDTLLTGEDGTRVGIEVTELVSGAAAAHHRRLKEQGLPPSYEWANWTPSSIAGELTRIVGVKDAKLKKAGGEFSQLLLAIVTDEPIIDEVIGAQAVRLCCPGVNRIDRAFLILSYHPSADKSQFPNHCPVLEIQLHRSL